MKKVLMFAVALMFPAFAIAESPSNSELNDAEIVHTIVTANQVFIENSELAEKKARNKNVHAFARRIIKESTDVNKQAKGLAAKLNVTPEDNAISKNLKADGKKCLDKLKNLSGSEFDKAYIDAGIKHHQKIIDVVDIQLVPAVKNEELKALLAKVHPALASHLEYADTIQSSVATNTKRDSIQAGAAFCPGFPHDAEQSFVKTCSAFAPQYVYHLKCLTHRVALALIPAQLEGLNISLISLVR